MSLLTGKVAFVTGGSRGIGLAIARAFVEQGAAVVITGTDNVRLDAASRDLASGGATVLPLRADVRRYQDVDAAMSDAVAKLGGLDVLVNNAGVGVFRSVATMSLDEWQRIIDTNVSGIFHCCRAALPHLRARGGGWIVNISSLSSTGPFADGAAYCASKAAVNVFSESLMQEVRHDGIRVACVLPGSVRTEFRGPSRGGDDWKLAPEDVAAAVVGLLGHDPRSLPSRVEVRPARPPRKV